MSEAQTISMSLDMAQAMNDLLLATNPKGRVENREHKHLMKALRAGCFEEYKYKNQQTQKDDMQRIFKVDGGSLEIERPSAIEYIMPILEKKISDGINGSLSIGYMDLIEAFEELKKC